jgi:hypothetical protein
MMRKKSKPTRGIQITVGGDVSGRVAAGQNISQVSTKIRTQVTKFDLEELLKLLKESRAKVEAEAQPDKMDAALERVEELEQAIEAERHELSTMEYVKKWFGKNLPGLASAVSSAVVHPIVGSS